MLIRTSSQEHPHEEGTSHSDKDPLLFLKLSDLLCLGVDALAGSRKLLLFRGAFVDVVHR